MSAPEPIGPDDIRAALAETLGCAPGDIGDGDDLIALGLNSIAMMAIAGGWRKRGIAITFAQLAAAPTVADWQRLLAAAAPAGAEAVESAPGPVDGDDSAPFPLAPMQHAYWIGRSAEQQLGGVAAHLYVEFDGAGVDPVRLAAAVDGLVAAHPMLRTRFLPDGTQQTLPAPGRPVFHHVDLRGLPADEVAGELDRLRETKTHQQLAIEDGEVLDVTLTSHGPGRSRLHLDIDMLAADAMSYRMLVAELAERYLGAAPPAPAYSYRRYRTEHGGAGANAAADRDYWQARLAELPGAPALPTVPAVAARTVRHAHRLDPAAKEALLAAAHRRGLTPASAVAAVFADVIAAWSGRPGFLLNVPLFHRAPVHPDIDRVAGDFTSSLLLDVPAAAPGESVADRARDIQRRLYDSGAHADYTGLDVLRDLGRLHAEPVLAPVVFTSALDLGELFAEPVLTAFGQPDWIVSQGPQVLLDAQITELAGGLLLNWDVRASAFPPGLIEAMFAAFTAAVDALAAGDAGWDAPAGVALPAGQARVRAAVNATDGPAPRTCLHAAVFDWAARTPGAAALCGTAGTYGYAELAGQALAVAGALHAAGVRPGDTVAIRLPKGPDQVVAVLGVLAAGAAYLPIGADQPAARCAKILEVAEPAAALGELPQALDLAAARRHPPLPEPVLADPDAVAYLLFTSGSTGTPKGVAVTHAAAMNTVAALNDHFGVGPADRILGLSALEFDLSVYDMFGAFAAGAALVAVDAAERGSAAAWVDLIAAHRVSILNCVPGLLEMILTDAGDRLADSLRAVLLGGDWVGADLARRLRRRLPHCRFAGLGGATEAAIHSTICEVTGELPAHWATVPYGVPLRNVRCRVVTHAGRDCPDWVPGELWIGGAGVALGYRGDAPRTAERFVEHDGLRWYRTGDLARYLPDGTLEFLGRADHQVQLRGYRIELGEVESALRSVPGVHEAVAVLVGERAPQLAAAITGDPGGDPSAALAELLPGYMVPARIAVLERMPLTGNGKLDRRAIAAALSAEPGAADGDEAADDVAAALADIVAGVLGVEAVGVRQDFFALGGDSVLATAVIARVRDWLQADHAVVADLFATRTVAGLAQRLQAREAQRGTAQRLAAVAAIYLEVAALSDEEVLAAE